MVTAPVCGTGDRRFESDYPPHFLNLQDISLADLRLLRYNFKKVNIGVSSSGKTQHFDCCIRRFKSCHPSHLKAPLKSEPPRFGHQWCFYYKTQYLCGFSRSHFLFASWTENRKTQIRQSKDLKTNLIEPLCPTARVL